MWDRGARGCVTNLLLDLQAFRDSESKEEKKEECRLLRRTILSKQSTIQWDSTQCLKQGRHQRWEVCEWVDVNSWVMKCMLKIGIEGFVDWWAIWAVRGCDAVLVEERLVDYEPLFSCELLNNMNPDLSRILPRLQGKRNAISKSLWAYQHERAAQVER